MKRQARRIHERLNARRELVAHQALHHKTAEAMRAIADDIRSYIEHAYTDLDADTIRGYRNLIEQYEFKAIESENATCLDKH